MLLALALSLAAQAHPKVDYYADVRFAVQSIERECSELLASKGIDWTRVTTPLVAESKKTKTDAEHLVLLVRLLARLQDGHCEVRPLAAGKDVKPTWPDRSAGPGLFLCRAQKKLWIKNAWGPASDVGITAGMELVSVDGVAAETWLAKRQAEIADLISFSTPQQAFFHTCHWGLAGPANTRLELELREAQGAKKKRTVTYGKSNQTARGPAFAPEGLSTAGDLGYGTTPAGFGYVHVRRCKEEVVQQMDEALAKLQDVPGLMLDFRGNSGGGFDHEALLGRFIPQGKEISFAGVKHTSAGPWSYGGPIVVIVDATVRSAGETGSGMFKEDGRAYMIGESATAGMASQKTTIALPSKLFELYVSTHSNKGRFNGGRGIEGLGVEPHEIVEFDPKDLAAGKDTLILRAEELLAAFPQKAVPYVPADFGWTGAKK